jgi:glucosamine kinase
VDSILLLGVDGGGSKCRARLTTWSGTPLGEGLAGPANIRLGLGESFASVLDATGQCLRQGNLSRTDLSRIVACLALAGASEPMELAAARAFPHPFRRALFTTDAHAACVGAHGGDDGGVIVVGTGTVGWAMVTGKQQRVGGWGFPISDEGSGAWLGLEILRRVLWAQDGRIAWTGLLTTVFEQFQSDPHAIVRWMGKALPRDFARFAPLAFELAWHNDPVAAELVRSGAGHINALAARLVAFGATRLALTGGLSTQIEPWLARDTRRYLVHPAGDALTGALALARAEAQARALAG